MTNSDALLDRLEQAVTLTGDDAAIRMHTGYEPQAGPQAKVFPPTYLPDGDTKYHIEQRWGTDGEPVDVVILDSIQSQANRAEEALRRAAEDLGLPQLVMVAELEHRTIRISSLDAPHRSRDAYFIDSELDGEPFDKTDIGQALARVNAGDATAALRYAPYDLIYGVWDSHRGKRMATKFPRVYTSEMLGWHVQRGKRAATKGDPINLKGTSEVPLDEVAARDRDRPAQEEERRAEHARARNDPGGRAGRGRRRLGACHHPAGGPVAHGARPAPLPDGGREGRGRGRPCRAGRRRAPRRSARVRRCWSQPAVRQRPRPHVGPARVGSRRW